ncbi:class I SAM-dependent methyltransferase [Piscinibacterium candidicorallinum]|uniref:Class I SAM-dependent methyltransferase n=2 Tax=Piscinibacterium candidicorallinum TaxID=1793872 RepID=A0ABV7H6Q0_9BURK
MSTDALQNAMRTSSSSERAPHTATPVHHAPARAGKMPAKARFILSMLERLEIGQLTLRLPDGSVRSFGRGEPAAHAHITDWAVFERAMASGDVGFGEAYMDGQFTTDDLAGLLTLLNANRVTIERGLYGSFFGRLVYRIKHLLNRNTKTKAKKNIEAHYDLGNTFYAEWLDPSMTYSSALFDGSAGQTLEQAQHAKLKRVFDRLQLREGAKVLEIGCGWGGFAELAARAGAHVTGLTLSSEQLAYARARLSTQGLSGATEFKLQDYRDEGRTGDAQYDGIASIEMFEAVGEEYWTSYFECLQRNLKSGGHACIQVITIADELFDRYRDGTDFIQQYIFPGGMLPSPSRFVELAHKHGFVVEDRFAFGRDYATTLRMWHQLFNSRREQVLAQGFDERFVRMWQFYLGYCEAGFLTGSTDVYQFTLRKAAA